MARKSNRPSREIEMTEGTDPQITVRLSEETATVEDLSSIATLRFSFRPSATSSDGVAFEEAPDQGRFEVDAENRTIKVNLEPADTRGLQLTRDRVVWVWALRIFFAGGGEDRTGGPFVLLACPSVEL